jgi:hypothetical protein
MMFMMPMPPTSRLTAATAPSSMVSTCGGAGQRLGDLRGVDDHEIVVLVGDDVAPFAHEQPYPRMTCGRYRGAVAPETIRKLTSWLPARRRCTVRSGIMTMSSWSGPSPTAPWIASRPITSQENLLDAHARCRPGLTVPNSSLRTVSPITHTALPARCSAGVKVRPSASSSCPAAK